MNGAAAALAVVTADPMPLVRNLLDAGANPNAAVNNTPRARMREGSPRIVFVTALMRAAFAADLGSDLDRTVVLVIDTDPQHSTTAGGAWWDVAVAEVSSRANVTAANETYRAKLADTKKDP